ncbi:unnamed protein product [Bursaphelenchus okinawaensis]|uniref:Uncharacterized protein n=1 Tax=Bursaphelenchus okinawaensis TaxID=465554 RepID=A0A811KC34_9BILA|nr:unnamed protein product [Bursaphelenchus okinawaensis]CAG9098058.1 unnamed protein product [Bursaphelenchus okinawaensis]
MCCLSFTTCAHGTVPKAKAAMDLFLNNDFEQAQQKMKPLADKTMYHALGNSTILFLQAMMTCDRVWN